ncbi:hypothetical protein GCM10027594_23730 [Hymenobacter agri]
MINRSIASSIKLVIGLLAILLLSPLGHSTQAQTLTWQTAIAAAGDVQVQASTTDGAGNVYLAGGFAGTATFGNTSFSTTNGREVFVAKWNRATGFVWAVKGNGSATTGLNQATAIAIYSPYVYVTGNFLGSTFSLGSSGMVLTNAQVGTSDIFLARLTESTTGASATVTWSKRAGGLSNDRANALTNVTNSALYLGGSSGGNATFDNYTLPGVGGFVARYSGFNQVQPVSPAPVVPAGDAVTALRAVGGTLYMAGTFSSTANAVPGGNLTSAGSEDIFVQKLNANNFTSFWVQQAGGSGEEYARCLLVSGLNVYVGGSYRSASAAFGTTTLTNSGLANLFVTKLVDTGSQSYFAWALQNSGTSTDLSNSANALNLYGTGLFVGGTFGGTIGLGSRSLTSAGGSDVLMAKVVDAGSSASFVSAQQAGGSGPDEATTIGRLDPRTVYVAGQTTTPTSFGSLSVGTSAGTRPGFVATLFDQAPLLSLAAPNTGPVGTTISLYGEGLTGATAITFAGSSNNVVTSGFTVNAAGTQISGVVVPAGAQSGVVDVTTPLGTSAGLVSFVLGTNPAPAWQAVSTAATPSLVRWAAPAANGTVIVAGEFNGSITVGGTTLTSLGSRDIFVAKFNPSTATYLWAVRAGSAGDEDSYGGVAVVGNTIYLAGQFYGPNITLGNTTLTPPTYSGLSGYVAKLTDAGSSASFIWAQLIDDASAVYVEALTASGNTVYVGGDFTGSALTIGNNTVLSSNASGDNGYVARLVDNGNTASFVWARGIGEADGSTINVYGLSVNGSILYVSGAFYGTLNFPGAPSITSTGTTATLPGPGDVAVLRLFDSNTAGSVTSTARAGGAGTEFVNSMSRQGNTLYVAGSTTDSYSFGGPPLSFPRYGYVLQVTDVNGTLTTGWVQILNNNVYQTAVNGTGIYAATSLITTDTFGSTTITQRGGPDGLVVRLADAGSSASVTWAQTAGGMGTDVFRALALAGGQVVVGGSVTPLAAFGSLVVERPIGVPVATLATIGDAAILATAAARPQEPLTLYPNPAHGWATLRLTAAGAGPIQLFDLLGREVRRYNAGSSTTSDVRLDLHGIPAGIYVVRAGTASRQLLVE